LAELPAWPARGDLLAHRQSIGFGPHFRRPVLSQFLTADKTMCLHLSQEPEYHPKKVAYFVNYGSY
jgi:hypothetical protein